MSFLRRLVVVVVFLGNTFVGVEALALQRGAEQPRHGQGTHNGENSSRTSLIDPIVKQRRDDFKSAVHMMMKSTQGAVRGKMQDAPRPRPAWLILAAQQASKEYMFIPIISTLTEAFQGAGVKMETVFAMDNACTFERMLEASAAGGLMPVVIAMQWWALTDPVASCSQPGTYGTLLAKVQTLSYLILYNEEPIDRIGQGGVLLQNAAIQLGANEVWSYSRYVMSLSEDALSRANIVSRYMPPGCAQAMDFGVQAVPGATPRNFSQLGFLGSWEARPTSVRQALASGLGDRVVTENQATSRQALQNYLTHCPLVQINVHTFRNPIGQALESFRVALLVMNGACIISEPVHVSDQQQYQGVVHFEQVSNFKVAFEALRDSPAAVAQCNTLARQALCMNFAPTKLLSDSGFLTFMQLMP